MFFSSGVYLCFSILMYVKRHEQFKIGCGAILNKIYYIILRCFSAICFLLGVVTISTYNLKVFSNSLFTRNDDI